MLGYMEVVCLILGPMLASQPCSHAFWVLTSLHLLSFYRKCFYYYCICTLWILYVTLCVYNYVVVKSLPPPYTSGAEGMLV